MTKQDLFTPLNKLDTLADNLGVTLDTIALVLDNLSASATNAEKGDDFAKAVFFRNNFDSLSSMIYLLLTHADDMALQAKEAIDQLWKLREQEVQA